MNIRQILLTAAAAAILTTTGAVARDRDHDGRPDNSWAEHHDGDGYRDDWRGHQAWHWRDDRGGWHADHDRYWRVGYGRYLTGDVFYRSLRAHNYYRWDGAPYWYRGYFVVRTYDRFGHPVFVELNPYTGGFIGVVRF